ncbi:MAG TPA: glycosyltransferase family 2 protein [Smithella sp.]|nr:glycosyltransferase family 2 protein [Smithella sp.]HOQ42310.1 glycosyltransferase family 2 protein [Smithellaceae bacterium]HQB13435.1 glycosyltransferase family 2 protein [Syntrophales bacterium]HOZ62330.1 glycosyltransferase family 2 protein [Smithellaceae bacterium]HPL67681.1 glycosyltransferase family 2 protein [Smithellaceae bacterium]
MQKLISIITPCFNEEENVREVYQQVKDVFAQIPAYRYEHIFIDNASTDKTISILREIAQSDFNVKVIINSRNFGTMNSYYAMFQCTGDAVIQVVADLQDPPPMIKNLIKKWEEGYKIVLAVKNKSEESKIMFTIRKLYYKVYNKVSNIQIVTNFCGFGLYDRTIIDIMRKIDDSRPDLRSLISEIGFEKELVNYVQPIRKKGKSKNNFYNLYDQAMLGITRDSIIPLRFASFLGFFVAVINLMVAMAYFIYKLIYWDSFQLGMAPMIIGIFFFGGVQLFFLGVIGEYIGAIFTQVKKRPLVIEKERINFD